MKNVKLKNPDRLAWVLAVFFIFTFSFLISLTADDFGDVSVEPGAIYTGNTFHGYAEMRVVLENRSSGKTHLVTLTYPNNPYDNYGNTISRLTRTVSLAPDTREVVSLLQPPLPAQGDNSIRVDVDRRTAGTMRAPNANSHCSYYSRGGQAATVFISRSLDFDAVERLFQANRGVFTAAMAVGPPDASSGRGGYQPNSWMPDTRRSGETNWLELDYATPQVVDRIVIHSTQPPVTTGFILLMSATGTNIAKLPMSSGTVSYTSGSSSRQEFLVPENNALVKTVQLNFAKTQPWRIGVDAVEISGTSGTQWASDARASSDNSASASAYMPGRANADAVESLRAEVPVSEWSENWLGYSPFDAVVLNASDLSAMPSAVLGALTDYLSAGGNVVLIGKTDLPAAWHPLQKKNLAEGVKYNIGFGQCFVFNSEKPAAIDSQSIQTLREVTRATSQYWQTLPDDGMSANAMLPVVGNLKIPTRGIIVIMLAFILLIGPVNIIYLNYIKRRTWMLWTIPAISFVTTLLVFAYSLLREGITPNTLIAGVTMLDQSSHRATTIGATAFYCPLTPSGGLHFDFETEATPLVRIGYGAGSAREVDWTQSQHFSRGWVTARVPVYFHLRKPETRRERVQVINDNGKLQIVNGLGAEITALWLADSNGNIYRAYNVDAGQKTPLIPATSTPIHMSDGKTNWIEAASGSHVTERLGAGQFFKDIGFTAQQDGLTISAVKYLLPNSYIAELNANPFIENALASSSPKRTKTSAVVFGILGEEDYPGDAK